MNAPVAFNTLSFVRRMEAAGMEARLAEALADALHEVIFETTATKGDLRELELKLSTDIKAVELKVELKIAELESRLMLRVGGMLAGSTALTVAILGALITFK